MNQQKGQKSIEWTDYTWNPIAGCKHECRWTMPNGSTAICYAERVAEGIAGNAYPLGFANHYWRPSLINEPLGVKQPSKIFVGSMADVFGAWVPDEQIQQILDVCTKAHWHTFQLLTKNAPRLLQFQFPPNVWIGASVPPSFMMGKALSQSQQQRMLIRTLSVLSEVKASVRWLSIEPLSYNIAIDLNDFGWVGDKPILNWAVIGAASKGTQYFQPLPEWVRSANAALDKMGAAVFYKGNLHGNVACADWREEFPQVQTVKQQALF